MLLILIVIVLASVSKLKVFFCLLNQCNRGNNHSNNSFSRVPFFSSMVCFLSMYELNIDGF